MRVAFLKECRLVPATKQFYDYAALMLRC
uniref:Uncharacterized protein n=1 Tax=Anguilla anguilla TaxID=7936 RepID=A0A0E9SNT4_ANGAN